MHFTTILTASAALATSAFAGPAALSERDTGDYGLSISLQNFDINSIYTAHVSYANTSAYIGAIKYESYSEPLVASGTDGLGFLSIHQTPTGYQQMYIVPHETQPVGFTVPHGGVPGGIQASTTGFSFNSKGNLVHNGVNRFHACQNAELASMNSYQIWWFGAGQPNGVSCKPVYIQKSDACARQ